MKITPKILSIPPYISTSWSNVASIHLRDKAEKAIVIISLNDGAQIEIPNMDQRDIDEIFKAHANFSEIENTIPKNLIDSSFSFSLPIKSGDMSLEALGGQMQHNPEQSDLPPIPPHILEKIGSIVRAFGIEEGAILDKAEPDCNCIYCQLSRTAHREPDEIVEDADLKFRDWDVIQKNEKLYHVTNPLDKSEYYDVFLGDPIGCTCGCKNCEHIRAALNT